MKTKLFLCALLLQGSILTAQNMTDASLFLRSDSTRYLDQVSSESGDLYNALGHHGPAIENEWLGLRLYFDKKAAIDVYSKANRGLELADYKWYPTAEQQMSGKGADYYKVGPTVGLGGIRLWDGENVVPLHPVASRSARVVKEGSVSFMEMLSEDVPYRNNKVDLLVRVTVYSGLRKAKVEAFALSDDDVAFVTGINYHPGQQVVVEDDCIFTWGLHPEDVAAEQVELGAAIFVDPDDFSRKMDDGNQHLFVSKPARYISYWISSANGKEPLINSLDRFIDFSKLEINCK
ncbi:DUF4861 family protein [Dysgonomonadaceae bacterium zrk40]|nr:DUF4861 family protein [Dysgonomonadaceae bacterium zrk40]